MKVLCSLLCLAFTSGFYIDNNETHEEKIVGGDNVRIVDVPYQASLLQFRINNFCGAAIIHESWIITASHCVRNNRSHISVRTGSGYRETLGEIHRVENTITFEDYDINNKNNDIALLKLAEPIQFNDKQRPIELAKPHDIPRERDRMRISGFGRIGEHLGKSHFLKAAYMPVRNQEQCRRVYRSFLITDNMFCAGNGDADACYGDSGGPGVIRGKLYGIISTNKNCSSIIYPGVFTRVHKYFDWIEDKTGLRF